MNPIDWLHERLHKSQRADRLARLIDSHLPASASILDVGSGDARIAKLLAEGGADRSVTCIDVSVRPDTEMEVLEFDGSKIPFEDDSFDVVTLIDVLHHTESPAVLLQEARRVANDQIVVKDHRRDGFAAYLTLRFMDRVGNKRFDVNLPHNYLSEKEWHNLFVEQELTVHTWTQDLDLMPIPLKPFFERGLHFISVLNI